MKVLSACLQFKKNKRAVVFNWRIAMGILLFSFVNPRIGNSQIIDNFNFTEISVTLNVARVGSMEMPVVIHGPVAYLPVKEIFDFLRIRNIQSPDLDSVSGFFINPGVSYLIDKMNNRIRYDDVIFQLKPGDLIRTETGLYLKADYFREVFGLDCAFSFRSLSVTLNTKIELPAIREMQQEMMRRNISQFKGEKKADTTVRRQFSMLHLGMADWAVIARQQTHNKMSAGVNLTLGAIVAGGETNLSLSYNSDQPFNLNQQYYNWRYVNNEHTALRQITAGKIIVQSVSSIYAPVTGVHFTNTPTTYKKSFGTYRLNSTTEPGWMVELYVNNVLINYTKADASGFFTFEVPLVYGNTVVKLRVYGPWGEERYREQNISIPFNFLPLHQFEYNVSAGIVDDSQKSRFSRGVFNYGLSSRITIGGGIEYLSSVTSGKSMPFLNASLRVGAHLLITGEHVLGVRSKGIVSYRLPGNVQIDLNYTKYESRQTAIKYNYLEERKIVLSAPFKGRNFNAFSRLTLNQFSLAKTKYTTAEFLLSGVVAGISSNLTTYGAFTNQATPYVYSNLSQTFRLPAGLRVIPQVQYEYMRKKFSMIRCEIEKSIFTNGLVNLSYQKDIVSNTSYTGLGIRYNFSFAQTSLNASRSNHTTTMIQSARGSLIYDGKTKYLGGYNQSSIGKGGVIIMPYLDLNGNGHREPNEPKAFGLNLHIAGGRIERNNKDTSIRILGLEAYNNYFIELDKNSFENIAWQIRKPTIRVTIDADNLRIIEVPVSVVGEASGTVSLEGEKGTGGIGRMIVNFYKSDSTLAGRTLSEADGYFSFLGFGPGTYTARIDTAQLRNLNFIVSLKPLAFTIKSSIEGVVVDGLDFTLQSTSKISNAAPVIQRDKIVAIIKDIQPVVIEKEQEHMIAKKALDSTDTTLRLLRNKRPLNIQKNQNSPGKGPGQIILHKTLSLRNKQLDILQSKQKPTINRNQDSLTSEQKQPVLKKTLIPNEGPGKGKNKGRAIIQRQVPVIKNAHDSLVRIPKPIITPKATTSGPVIKKQRQLVAREGKATVSKEENSILQKRMMNLQVQQFILKVQLFLIRAEGVVIENLLPLTDKKYLRINKQKLSINIRQQQLLIKELESIARRLRSGINKIQESK